MQKLLHGDCLDLMKDIPDKSIDMILCDLPYGTTACKWDNVIPFEPLWEQYNRIIKDNGAIVLFGSEPFSSYLRMSNIKNYKYDWVWDKTRGFQPQLANIQPMKSHEIISVFGKRKVFYNPQKTKISKPDFRKATEKPTQNRNDGLGQSILSSKFKMDKVYTDRFPLSIVRFSKNPAKESLHPTQKPVALLEYLIKTYTLEGETVLDNCMGFGSTGVACINTNRNFIGMELEENYFQIAKNRIEQAERDKACQLDFGEEL